MEPVGLCHAPAVSLTQSSAEPTDRRAARVVASVAALALIAYWAFFSFVMLLIRCGDNCSSDAEAAHWRYTAQFVLAAGSCLVGVVGLALGFAPRLRRAALGLGAVALAGAVAWVLWVIGFGAF